MTTQTSQIEKCITIGKIEGYSYLALLGIAMPLKHFMNLPEAVKVCGSIHGVLFVWFCFMLLNAFLQKQLSFKQCALSFVLSLLPFGTFFLRKICTQNSLHHCKLLNFNLN